MMSGRQIVGKQTSSVNPALCAAERRIAEQRSEITFSRDKLVMGSQVDGLRVAAIVTMSARTPQRKRERQWEQCGQLRTG